MKTESIGRPIIVAAILALGVAAAWALVAMTTSATVLPRDAFGLPENSLPVTSFESVLCPSPAMLAVLQFALIPLELNRSRPLDAHWPYVESMFVGSWFPFLVVCLISAGLAWWCYRHHRRFSDRGAAAWAAFVFVMGVPGLIGYLLHRRWPTTELCQHCGKESPRDRDACLHCRAEFPPPAMKGIEIFA